MTDILEPSRKVKTLRAQIWLPAMSADKRLISDALREIQRECITLEIQRDVLEMENRRLVHEANIGLPDEEIAF